MKPLILDSALGTELENRGEYLPSFKTSIWSAYSLIHNPEAIKQIHIDNIEAGADVITTSNYLATPELLKREPSAPPYEDLASPRWKGQLCIRSSDSVYNQSLVASMIEVNGIEKTESWARGLVQNFARPPTGGDTDLLKATAAGQCTIALANTYYFGRLINSKMSSERKAAQNLAVFWPNQGAGDRGVHVNVSGAGITKHARNINEALSLLEFLVTDESQEWYAEVNNEYPVVEGAVISKTLKSFGTFKADSINLTILGVNNPAAVKLMDRAGWR